MRTVEWVRFMQIAEREVDGTGGVAIGTYTQEEEDNLILEDHERSVTLGIDVPAYSFSSTTPTLEIQTSDTPELESSWTTVGTAVGSSGAPHAGSYVLVLFRDILYSGTPTYRIGRALRWKITIPAPSTDTTSRIVFRITATVG